MIFKPVMHFYKSAVRLLYFPRTSGYFTERHIIFAGNLALGRTSLKLLYYLPALSNISALTLSKQTAKKFLQKFFVGTIRNKSYKFVITFQKNRIIIYMFIHYYQKLSSLFRTNFKFKYIRIYCQITSVKPMHICALQQHSSTKERF